jgi:hypothetical protein
MWGLAPLCSDAEIADAALETARSLPDQTYRVQAVAALIDVLDVRGQQAAIGAIATAPSDFTRLMGLELVWPSLHPDVHGSWRDAVQQTRGERAALLLNAETTWRQSDAAVIEEPLRRSQGAGNSAPAVPRLVEHVDQSPRSADGLGSSPRTHLPQLSLLPLLNRLRTLGAERDRYDLLTGAITRLSPDALEELLLWLPEHVGLDHQIDLWGSIAAHLPASRRGKVWRAAEGLESPTAIQRAVDLLLRVDPNIDRACVYHLFTAVIADACEESRPLALARVQAVSQTMRFMDGDEPLLETMKAISEVGALWP